MQNKSEVVCLMQQIQAEYKAGVQAMTGLSMGTAQHKFITMRMENMGKQVKLLHELGGDQAVKEFFDQWA